MGTQIVIGSNGSVVVSTVASITSSSEIRCLGLRNLQFNAVFSSPVLFQFYLSTSSPFPFLGSFKFFYNSNNRSDEHYYGAKGIRGQVKLWDLYLQVAANRQWTHRIQKPSDLLCRKFTSEMSAMTHPSISDLNGINLLTFIRDC